MWLSVQAAVCSLLLTYVPKSNSKMEGGGRVSEIMTLVCSTRDVKRKGLFPVTQISCFTGKHASNVAFLWTFIKIMQIVWW